MKKISHMHIFKLKSLSICVLSFLFIGCNAEKGVPCTEDVILSEIIIGSWELSEKMGFPYSSTAFEAVENEFSILEFYENGEMKFIQSNGEIPGTYTVEDDSSRILIETTVSIKWDVSYFSDCEFILDIYTIEGLSRSKYLKI